jgi:hypothetical protein
LHAAKSQANKPQANKSQADRSQSNKSLATKPPSKFSIQSSLDILSPYSHVEMERALAVHRGRIYKCRRNIASVLSR